MFHFRINHHSRWDIDGSSIQHCLAMPGTDYECHGVHTPPKALACTKNVRDMVVQPPRLACHVWQRPFKGIYPIPRVFAFKSCCFGSHCASLASDSICIVETKSGAAMPPNGGFPPSDGATQVGAGRQCVSDLSRQVASSTLQRRASSQSGLDWNNHIYIAQNKCQRSSETVRTESNVQQDQVTRDRAQEAGPEPRPSSESWRARLATAKACFTV